jgi:hypothetical protein
MDSLSPNVRAASESIATRMVGASSFTITVLTDTLPPYVIRNLLSGTRWSEDDLRRLKLIR